MQLFSKIRDQFIKPKEHLDITIVGSCLSNFVVSSYLENHLPPNLSIRRLTSALQLRTDIILELLEHKGMDIDLVEHYLKAGKWGKSATQHKYAQWFSSFVLEKCLESRNIHDDCPDLLIMDSLCDIRHSLYAHRSKGWKAFFGNIQFSDASVEKNFTNEFCHIGLLPADEQLKKLIRLVMHFKKRNSSLRVVYMHFPLNPNYVDQKWIARSSHFEMLLNVFLERDKHKDILSISVPEKLNIPVTDPEHPNYSPQIWNHFYPETYNFFAEHISHFILNRKPMFKPSGTN
ncbi:hypothetical protein [Desulfosediminicola sp.]|uniref:hypothetical protein n=1 Tax=Desulfosediminicola sp. TaxID=2886825 RepID=UPI003AF24DDC